MLQVIETWLILMAIPVGSSKQFDILNLVGQLLNLYVDMLRDFNSTIPFFFIVSSCDGKYVKMLKRMISTYKIACEAPFASNVNE